ncbi:MAG: hypothetical protein SFU99_13470 [Saprospiraceae bacterium]|nr:hypothetical protein [Saprospiraceae bacterium]
MKKQFNPIAMGSFLTTAVSTVLCLTLFTASVIAQVATPVKNIVLVHSTSADNSDYQKVTKKKKGYAVGKVGGFGGPIVEFGLKDDLSISYGGGGGVVVGGAFFGGYGLVASDLNAVIDGKNMDNIDLAHGGIWLGYAYKTQKFVHLYSSARIGWGTVKMETEKLGALDAKINDPVFVLTPEIGVECNVFEWFRVSGTLGYRWLNGTNGNGTYYDEDFSSAVSTLTLRFGWFGNSRF